MPHHSHTETPTGLDLYTWLWWHVPDYATYCKITEQINRMAYFDATGGRMCDPRNP
jgi:hypothetical protein